MSLNGDQTVSFDNSENCFFCCSKPLTSEHVINSAKLIAAKLPMFCASLQNFVNFLDRPNFGLLTDDQVKQLCLCAECLSLVEQFLEEYHRWKCVQLRLEWRIAQFLGILQSTNKKNGSTSNPVENLRSAITQTCALARSNSQPRVRLCRIQPNSWETSSSSSSSEYESEVELAEVKVKKEPSGTLEGKRNESSISMPNHTLKSLEMVGDSLMEIDDDFGDFHVPPSPETPIRPTENLDKTLTRQEKEEKKHARVPDQYQKPRHRCNFCKLTFPNYAKYRDHVYRRHQLRRRKKILKKPLNNKSSYEPNTAVQSSSTEPPMEQQQQQHSNGIVVKSEIEKRYNLRVKENRNYAGEEVDEGRDMERSRRQKRKPDKNKDEKMKSDPNEHLRDSDSSERSDGGNDEQFTCERQDSRKYSCRVPDCPLRSVRLYRRRYRDHQALHVKGQYKCNFCPNVSDTIILLAIHERVAHAPTNSTTSNCEDSKKVYQCSRCSYQTQGQWPYFRHFITDHKRHIHQTGVKKESDETAPLEDDIDDDDLLECNYCGKTFLYKGYLKHHKRIFHSRNAIPEQPVPQKFRHMCRTFVCPVAQCTAGFLTREQLRNHGNLHGSFQCQFCPKQVSYAPDLASHELEHVEKKDRNLLSCSRCKAKFHLKSYLARHFCSEHLGLSVNTSRCPICQIPVKETPFFLQHHVQVIHGINSVEDNPPEEAVHCDLCPAFFRIPKYLHKHKMRDHWKGQCPECPYTVTTVGPRKWFHFTGHLTRMHPLLLSVHFRFVCLVKQCGYRCGDQKTLDKHTRISHPVEKFQCSQCEKTFPTNSRLSGHEWQVHSQQSYVCAECGKAFKVKAKLLQHMDYHKPPSEWKFQCDVCEKRFVTKQKLMQHGRTHTKEKPFVCHVCGEKYAHRHNWKAHLKSKHAEEFERMEGEEGQGRKKEGNYMKRKGSKKGDCLLTGAQKM